MPVKQGLDVHDKMETDLKYLWTVNMMKPKEKQTTA